MMVMLRSSRTVDHVDQNQSSSRSCPNNPIQDAKKYFIYALPMVLTAQVKELLTSSRVISSRDSLLSAHLLPHDSTKIGCLS